MTKILIIGKSGRFDCIAEALAESERVKEIYAVSEVNNPGVLAKAKDLKIGKTDDVNLVADYALKVKPDFAVIGPEEPLAAGVVDKLISLGIPCVGPTQSLARLESSKSFTRQLISKYNIPGNPEYRIFQDSTGLESYLRRMGKFVIKPDGLTGGKGVKVFGEHFNSIAEAIEYCQTIFEEKQTVIIEEKLDGEEFSLQSFCDGQHVADTVVVQDHKRVFEGDEGPNTGGMGSYTCEDHKLPFLSENHLLEASKINKAVGKALQDELGQGFKGILYGGFMITKDGLRLLEYNARFGDPEVMNILPLLKNDFIEVCEAIIAGTLDKIKIEFEKKATVCKYVVPNGYPVNPVKDVQINLSNVPKSSDKLRMYYAAVNKRSDGLYLAGSRAVAFVGIGNDLHEAEQISEDAVRKVEGPVYHRNDIGTNKLIQKRISHMKTILGEDSKSKMSLTA